MGTFLPTKNPTLLLENNPSLGTRATALSAPPVEEGKFLASVKPSDCLAGGGKGPGRGGAWGGQRSAKAGGPTIRKRVWGTPKGISFYFALAFSPSCGPKPD